MNFEDFKDGFVAALSHSLDLSTSEDDSSYLEPGDLGGRGGPGPRVTPGDASPPAVVPEEVKPKFVKGKKRYGRRSRPDGPEGPPSRGSDDLGPVGMEPSELSPSGIRRAKLRRSTSLESIEVRHRPPYLALYPLILITVVNYTCVPCAAGRGRYAAHRLIRKHVDSLAPPSGEVWYYRDPWVPGCPPPSSSLVLVWVSAGSLDVREHVPSRTSGPSLVSGRGPSSPAGCDVGGGRGLMEASVLKRL